LHLNVAASPGLVICSSFVPPQNQHFYKIILSCTVYSALYALHSWHVRPLLLWPLPRTPLVVMVLVARNAVRVMPLGAPVCNSA